MVEHQLVPISTYTLLPQFTLLCSQCDTSSLFTCHSIACNIPHVLLVVLDEQLVKFLCFAAFAGKNVFSLKNYEKLQPGSNE